MHGVTALIEVDERRHVVAELLPQRRNDGIALLAEGRLLIVLVETDGAVKIFELFLH
ncbi:hypothetical protein D3C80_2208970 [compost metagenome]